MRLAVSNIAWTTEEDADVHAALVDAGVDAIEIAPTRIWAEPADAPLAQAREHAARLADAGLETVSFQSLLFARPDLTLFDDAERRSALLAYLGRIAALAGAMGATRLVFGSPKARIVPGGMSDEEAFEIAAAFFRSAGDAAAGEGTMLCIEPNPPAYGCNFVTTADAGLELVKAAASPGFALHLDAAGLVLAGDDPAAAARASGVAVRHVHASAPQLGELETEIVDHVAFAEALRGIEYSGIVSVEMRAGAPGDNISRVRSAIGIATAAYGG